MKASWRRYARKRQQTPLWADRTAIRAIYDEAKRRTAETGVPHAVDHVYPLAGRCVSGLHVETNLRVVTQRANAEKSNRAPGEKPLGPRISVRVKADEVEPLEKIARFQRIGLSSAFRVAVTLGLERLEEDPSLISRRSPPPSEEE